MTKTWWLTFFGLAYSGGARNFQLGGLKPGHMASARRAEREPIRGSGGRAP